MSAPPVVIVQTPAPPAVVVAPPVVVATPPAVTVDVGVPDSYTWDGYEYVGLVGDQYYYLGPDHVWLVLDAPRLARFHDWERGHADWRAHAIHNELYRHAVQQHDHDVQQHDRDVQRHEEHDRDHDHGH